MNNHYNKKKFLNPSINIMRLNKPHSPQTTSLELFNPHPPSNRSTTKERSSLIDLP